MKKKIKKIAIWGSASFLFLILTAGILIKVIVTKDFIAEKIEENTNARIEISDISVPLWSVFSGITIEGFKIGYKDQETKKPMAERSPMKDHVIGFKSFDFKVAVGKLITSFGKDFELKSILLTEPSAKIVLYEKGGNNLDRLFLSSNEKEEKQPEEKKEADEQEDTSKQPEESRPFSIKSIPTIVKMSKIGLEKGDISVYVEEIKNKIKIKDLNLLVEDIYIDPKNLENPEKNKVMLNLGFVMSLDEHKGEGIQSFKIIFSTTGKIMPFHPKTGEVNENVSMKISLHKGTHFTGLALFEKLKKNTEQLKKIGVNLNFLKDDIELKNDASMGINYDKGKITVSDEPKIITDDAEYIIKKDSWVNIKTFTHRIESDLSLANKHTQKVEEQVEKVIKPAFETALKKLPAKIKKIAQEKITVSQLRDNLLKPARNPETNQIMLGFLSHETFSKPKVEITKPEFPSVKEIVKNAVNDAKNNLSGMISAEIDKLKNKAKEEIDKAKAEPERKKAEAEAKLKAEAEKKKAEAEAKAKAEAEKKATNLLKKKKLF